MAVSNVAAVDSASEQHPLGAAPPAAGRPATNGVHPAMLVVGQAGTAIGKITTVEHDAATGDLDAFVVRHGVFGQRHTVLAAGQIAQCDGNTVTLTLSYDAFKAIPTREGR